MKLNKSEQMLFALLKGSLNNSPAVCDIFTDTTSQEWEKCYFSASNRGGMALAWEIVQELQIMYKGHGIEVSLFGGEYQIIDSVAAHIRYPETIF